MGAEIDDEEESGEELEKANVLMESWMKQILFKLESIDKQAKQDNFETNAYMKTIIDKIAENSKAVIENSEQIRGHNKDISGLSSRLQAVEDFINQFKSNQLINRSTSSFLEPQKTGTSHRSNDLQQDDDAISLDAFSIGGESSEQNQLLHNINKICNATFKALTESKEERTKISKKWVSHSQSSQGNASSLNSDKSLETRNNVEQRHREQTTDTPNLECDNCLQCLQPPRSMFSKTKHYKENGNQEETSCKRATQTNSIIAGRMASALTHVKRCPSCLFCLIIAIVLVAAFLIPKLGLSTRVAELIYGAGLDNDSRFGAGLDTSSVTGTGLDNSRSFCAGSDSGRSSTAGANTIRFSDAGSDTGKSTGAGMDTGRSSDAHVDTGRCSCASLNIGRSFCAGTDTGKCSTGTSSGAGSDTGRSSEACLNTGTCSDAGSDTGGSSGARSDTGIFSDLGSETSDAVLSNSEFVGRICFVLIIVVILMYYSYNIINENS